MQKLSLEGDEYIIEYLMLGNGMQYKQLSGKNLKNSPYRDLLAFVRTALKKNSSLKEKHVLPKEVIKSLNIFSNRNHYCYRESANMNPNT